MYLERYFWYLLYSIITSFKNNNFVQKWYNRCQSLRFNDSERRFWGEIQGVGMFLNFIKLLYKIQ